MIPTPVTPSLQGRFSLIWSGDSAIQPRPTNKKQGAQWDKSLEVCRETGQWSALLKEGEEPTVFVFQFPTGTARRKLLDLIGNLAGSSNELIALFLRATIREVTGLGEYTVTLVKDRTLGMDLVSDELIDILDAVSPAIAYELAAVAVQRFVNPPGK